MSETTTPASHATPETKVSPWMKAYCILHIFFLFIIAISLFGLAWDIHESTAICADRAPMQMGSDQ